MANKAIRPAAWPVLCAVSFLLDCSFATAIFALPLLAIKHLQATASQLGYLGAVGATAYALACVPGGTVADRFSARMVARAGATLGMVALLAMPQAPQVHAWLSARFGPGFPGGILYLLCCGAMGGTGLGFFWPALQKLTAQHGGRSLSGSLGAFNLAWSTGLMLGPLAGAALSHRSVMPPLYAGAVGYAAVLLLMGLVPTKPGVSAPAEAEDGDGHKVAPAVGLSFLYMAWAANFASWYCSNTARYLLAKLTHSLGIGEAVLGWELASIHLGQVAMFLVLRWWQGWHYRAWPLLGGQALGLAGMLLVYFGRVPGVWLLGFLASGMMTGVTYYSSLYYSLHTRPGEQGRTAGKHEAILGTGILLGPLLGGKCADWTGDLHAPYLLCAFVVLVCGIAGGALRMEAKRRVKRNASIASVEGLAGRRQ